MEVLDADGHAVTLVFAEEWLRCDVSDGSLDVVAGLLRVFQLSLDVGNLLGLQLQAEVLLLDSLVLLIHSPKFLLHLSDVVLRLLENRLVVLKIALQPLHLTFNGSDLPLHVQYLTPNLIGAPLAHRATILGNCFFQLLLELEHFALIYRDLSAQIFGFVLVPFGDFTVGNCKFALYVSVLVILG